MAFQQREQERNVKDNHRHSPSDEVSLQKNKGHQTFQISCQALLNKSDLIKQKNKDHSRIVSLYSMGKRSKMSHTRVKVRNLQYVAPVVRKSQTLNLSLKVVKKAKQLCSTTKTLPINGKETPKIEKTIDLQNKINGLKIEYDDSIKNLGSADSKVLIRKTYEISKQILARLILVDHIYGGILSNIKQSYDSYIESLRGTESTVKRNPIVSEKMVNDTLLMQTQTMKMLKQTNAVAKVIFNSIPAEPTRPVLVQQKTENSGFNAPQSKPKQEPSVKLVVPPLKLPVNNSSCGFHQEFTDKHLEFSPSWRQLLKEERKPN